MGWKVSLAGRSILCDEVQHALSRVIAVIATEDVGAVGVAGIDVDFFGWAGDIVHMSGVSDERIVILAGDKKLGGIDGFYLIIAHAGGENLRT